MLTVVTGASGHAGVNLVRALIREGRGVLVLSHSSNLGLEGLLIKFFKGDVSNIDSLVEAFLGAEVVYHLAAHISLSMNDWPHCAAINMGGTRNVIEACLRSGVKRLVHFNSIHSLCSEPLDLPVDESRPLVSSPKSPPYDRSKAGGEKLIRYTIKEGLNAIIINPTGIIGPYDYRPSHFGQALIQIATGKIPMLIEGGFDWVDVRDVAKWAIKAEQVAPAGSNYLLSGTWLSMKDLARLVAEITGTATPYLVCPMTLARMCAPVVTAASRITGVRPIFTTPSLDALQNNRGISHSKATRELGYSPRPIRETLADTIQWFQENDFLKVK